jgi:hypothetical protein
VSQVDYDEPGTRTRQAWLRTCLGLLAVSLFIARGLALGHVPAGVVAVALLPAVVFLAMAVWRSAVIRPRDSAPLPRGVPVASVLVLGALALAALGSVLLP